MKKIAIVAVMAICAASFTACGNKSGKGKLKNNVDSLSYIIGMEQGQNVGRMLQQAELDSTYVNEFLKGFEAGANEKDDKDKTAYNLGVYFGQMLNQSKGNINQYLFAKDSTQTINVKLILAGMKDAAKGKKTLVDAAQVQLLERALAEKIQRETAEKLYGANKKRNEAYMAKLASDKSLKRLANGIYYKVEKEGTGEIPTMQSVVTLEYEGKTIDGKVFDSTKEHGSIPMPVSQNIAGFKEVLTHMPVGSTWTVYIPADQAYGSQEVAGGKIQPFSALIFKVTLVGIEKGNQQPAPQMMPQMR